MSLSVLLFLGFFAVAVRSDCPCQFEKTATYDSSSCKAPCLTIESIKVKTGAVGKTCCSVNATKEIDIDVQGPHPARILHDKRFGKKVRSVKMNMDVTSRPCFWQYYCRPLCYYVWIYQYCYNWCGYVLSCYWNFEQVSDVDLPSTIESMTVLVGSLLITDLIELGRSFFFRKSRADRMLLWNVGTLYVLLI